MSGRTAKTACPEGENGLQPGAPRPQSAASPVMSGTATGRGRDQLGAVVRAHARYCWLSAAAAAAAPEVGRGRRARRALRSASTASCTGGRQLRIVSLRPVRGRR